MQWTAAQLHLGQLGIRLYCPPWFITLNPMIKHVTTIWYWTINSGLQFTHAPRGWRVDFKDKEFHGQIEDMEKVMFYCTQAIWVSHISSWQVPLHISANISWLTYGPSNIMSTILKEFYIYYKERGSDLYFIFCKGTIRSRPKKKSVWRVAEKNCSEDRLEKISFLKIHTTPPWSLMVDSLGEHTKNGYFNLPKILLKLRRQDTHGHTDGHCSNLRANRASKRNN